MICKNCGYDNPDKVTFCQNCGKRMDGKKVCPSCGAQIEEDAKFCGFCGAGVEGKAKAEVAVATADENASAPAKHSNVQKVLSYVGLGLLAFSALMGFIFTFCIGIETDIATLGKSYMLYEYFGNAYENISTTGATVPQEILLYLPNAFGTLISAGALIANIVFFALTVSSAVKQFAYKRENTNFTKYATGTFLSFALFSMLFLALHAISATSTASSISVNGGITFNKPTLAGLVLSGIGFGGYCCCCIASNISKFKNSKVLVNGVITLILAIIAIVVLGLVSAPVIQLKYSYSSSYYTQKMECSVGYFMASALSAFSGTDEYLIKLVAFEFLGFTSQIIIACLTLKLLVKFIGSVCKGDKPEKLLGSAITNLVFSVVNIACAVLFAQELVENSTSLEGTSLGYAMPIALLVLNVLVLAGVIVYKVYSSRMPIAEETTY
ncbi:MAG: zinc ribbon domain-containing protein [Clostridia bacterium]|nr:zinc ribbon domain-containing protein [Clostridia bacterium]